jgi:hypothetical protein
MTTSSATILDLKPAPMHLNLNGTHGVATACCRYNAFIALLGFSFLGWWEPMKFIALSLRKIFLVVFPFALLGIVLGSDLVRSQDTRVADVSRDLINKINWKQDATGNMIASFVMSNYGDRDIREVVIGCEYTIINANGFKKIERTLKDDDLATSLAGEFLMRAHSGRHYIDINFGPIDPVKSVRYMACKVSNAKF